MGGPGCLSSAVWTCGRGLSCGTTQARVRLVVGPKNYRGSLRLLKGVFRLCAVAHEPLPHRRLRLPRLRGRVLWARSTDRIQRPGTVRHDRRLGLIGQPSSLGARSRESQASPAARPAVLQATPALPRGPPCPRRSRLWRGDLVSQGLRPGSLSPRWRRENVPAANRTGGCVPPALPGAATLFVVGPAG